jgi:N-acetylmuramoyl-L-alanine amidase
MKKIYINPGHSDKDPGAVSYEIERKLNVAVANYMNEYLLANYVCETRMNPGEMDSLIVICNDANNWGADLFVSIHFNAGRGDGYEALVYNEYRRSLGRIFEKYILEIGQNSRGIKMRPGLYVLKHTNMPAILNEGAFVDNKKDIEDWNEDHELKVMGEAYAKAAAEYLKLAKKNVQTDTEVVETKPDVKPEAIPETKVEEKVEVFKPYLVRVTASALNVRKGPGINFAINTRIVDKGVYTIVEESNECWGKLKSGSGWINLNYTKKI